MSVRINLEGYTCTDKHQKFEFYRHEAKKNLVAIPTGHYTKEDSDAAGAAYVRNIEAIKPSEYTFILECSTLDTSTPKLVEELVGLMKFYEATGFKRIVLLKPDSLIATKQLEKVIRTAGVTMELADSF